MGVCRQIATYKNCHLMLMKSFEPECVKKVVMGGSIQISKYPNIDHIDTKVGICIGSIPEWLIDTSVSLPPRPSTTIDMSVQMLLLAHFAPPKRQCQEQVVRVTYDLLTTDMITDHSREKMKRSLNSTKIWLSLT